MREAATDSRYASVHRIRASGAPIVEDGIVPAFPATDVFALVEWTMSNDPREKKHDDDYKSDAASMRDIGRSSRAASITARNVSASG